MLSVRHECARSFALCVNGVSAIAVVLCDHHERVSVVLCERHERKRSFLCKCYEKEK